MRWLLVLSIVFGLGIAIACGGTSFDPQSRVTSVRQFGTRVDRPFTRPGEVVTMEVLTVDRRREKPRPLVNYWIPAVCLNPREDLYYLCFAAAANGLVDGGTAELRPPSVDAGVADGGLAIGGGGGLTAIPTGIDLAPFLPQGPTFSFRMPDDAVIPREGIDPYGLAIVFNVACAGQVRFAPITSNNPQASPIQCTDESGNVLGPDDYVIGINRVYAYTDRENANPTVERVTLNGVDVDPVRGITLERCTTQKLGDCPSFDLDVKVPEASWEVNPSGASSGSREQIWVTYYSDVGRFEDDARLLYDTTSGRITESDVELRAPKEVTDGTIWAVVHDNRAGAAFVTLPLHIR